MLYLRPPQGEHWDEDLPALVHALVDLLEEVPLPAPLRVADGRGVGGLGDQQVWTAFVNPMKCVQYVVQLCHATHSFYFPLTTPLLDVCPASCCSPRCRRRSGCPP